MEGDDLIINGNIRVKHFNKQNNDLGITLLEADEIAVSLEGKSSVAEGDGGKHYEEYGVKLNRQLQKGEWLILKTVDPSGKERYIFRGDMSCESAKPYYEKLFFKQSYGAYLSWSGNDKSNEDIKTMVGVSVYAHSDNIKVKSITPKEVTIKDDDRDPDDPETEGSPIVIDLNNDGINTLSLDYTRNFDLDNNGFAEATGWIQKDDALLAYDRNGNGKIDNGSELFGNHTLSDNYYSHTSGNTNGFNALKEFDTNNDGIIDKNDKDFDKLLLWQDKNSNAITDEGELIKLSDKVRSIDLNYKQISTSNNGNSIRQTSTATLNDGTKVKADDVWFKVSLNKTKEIIDQDKIPLDTQALPQVIASGNLNSLRVAASKNETLATMINLYLMLSPEDRKKHIDELVYEWTEVNGVDPDSRSIYMNAKNLVLYEKLTGKPFNQLGRITMPGPNASNRVNEKVNTFIYYVYATIELQTTYSDLNLDMETMSLKKDGGLSYKFDALNSRLTQLYSYKKYDEITKLMGIIQGASAYRPIFRENLRVNLLNFCGNDDKLLSLCLDTYISGTDGNDVINGNSEGNFINGGKGNDWLNGGEGNDTYIFNKGDGADTIIDYGGNNILKLGAGLDKKDLIISQNSNGYILLSFKDNASDSITLTSPNIQVLEFANGDKMNIDEIKKLSLIGDDTDNTIYGYNGENNILVGNKGNDTLNGGYGDDTYIFNKGDGNDIIADYGGINTLQFGEGISRSDLEFNVINSGSDLKISFKNSSSDSIVINRANIKNIKFSNGEILKLSDIDNIKIMGTEGDDVIRADINASHIIEGGDGDDNIRGNDYTKSINGGKGNDWLNGGEGNDTYIFNKGDGNDIINDIRGSSTIKFGEGINKEDISFARKQDKLIISIKGDGGKIGDSITILNFFYANPEISISNNPIKTISFADGSIYDFNKILELVPLSSTDEDDEVYLTKKNDIFDAGLGNDKIWGNDGDDIIDGNKGNDSLFGDNGNDTLIGGKGNDKLFGGEGNDIYIFNKGDGHDTIMDDIGNNVIKFGEGINKEDLVISRNPYNERGVKFLFKNNTNDSISVNSIDALSIEFANGDKLGPKEIKKLPLFGSDANDTIRGFFSNRNTFIGNGGNDILEGDYGGDIYIFNKGDGKDTIMDYDGIDVIKLNDFNYSDIEIKRDGDNLVINSKVSDDSIKIRKFYHLEEKYYFNSIEYIKFKDGSIYNLLNEKFIVATNENDRIFLTNLDDEINGLDGDDVINGEGGNDILIGGKGNDTLDGGDDNDTLIGGEGNDTLYGEEGNDVLTGGDW